MFNNSISFSDKKQVKESQAFEKGRPDNKKERERERERVKPGKTGETHIEHNYTDPNFTLETLIWSEPN